MRKSTFLLSILFLLFSFVAQAQTFTEWQDPHINSINRLPMHSTFLPEGTRMISLAGDWSFNWVRSANQHPVGFWSPDYKESSWGKMKIPAVW